MERSSKYTGYWGNHVEENGVVIWEVTWEDTAREGSKGTGWGAEDRKEGTKGQSGGSWGEQKETLLCWTL